MILYLVLLVVGLILLVGGGDALVRGASSLARSLGISPLVIGLTVVAFGTSAPELAVNVFAAIAEKGDISFGNIIGSNIANIGLILGCCALVRPLAIRRTVIIREIPMMLAATGVVVVMALDPWLRDGGAEVVAEYDRGEGTLLLLLFVVFIVYLARDALRQRRDAFLQQAEEYSEEERPRTTWISVVLVAVGLIGLVGGGKLTVIAAEQLALEFGVPDVVVSLTLVALGTSLPELVTGAIATYRGHTDLAIGNVVGSNIFNLLLVQGVTAVVRPIPIPEGGYLDLIVVSGLSLIVLPMAITNQRQVKRGEGAFLLVAYLAYCGYRAFG